MTADEIWVEVICDSVAEMNSFEGTDFTAAAEMAADFLPDLKEAVLESKKESRGPPAGNVEGKASREISKRRSKVPPMNEFATNAMQWARSVKTEVGEQKLFYRKGKWVLLEKSDDGYIEVATCTSKQYNFISKEISKHNEKIHDRGIDERIHRSVVLYESIGSGDSRNNRDDVGQQTRDGSAGGLYQGESASNGGRDNQEGEHHTGHFSIKSDSGKASTDLEFFDFLSENARDGAKNLQNTRAPPSNSQVKASRATRDLYTATDAFIREVPWGDRSHFSRSLAYKTNGMIDSEIRVVTIYAGQIYLFKADGYMHGEMIQIFGDENLDEINTIIEEKKNEFERTEKTIDQWEADERNSRIFNGRIDPVSVRNGGHYGSPPRVRNRGTTERIDSLYDEQSRRNSSGNNEQGGRNNYSVEEIDAILKPLKEMYGVDDSSVKASRASKGAEEIARAYLDAVPKRMILANALESVASSESGKSILNRYKDHLSKIENNRAEIERLKDERKKAEKDTRTDKLSIKKKPNATGWAF